VVPEPVLIVTPEPVIAPGQPEPAEPTPPIVVVPGIPDGFIFAPVQPEPVVPTRVVVVPADPAELVTAPDQVETAPADPVVPQDLVSGLPVLPPTLEGLPAVPGPALPTLGDLDGLFVTLPPGLPSPYLDDLLPTAPPIPDGIPIVLGPVPGMDPGQPDQLQPSDWHL
jgi:hypothetical protein